MYKALHQSIRSSEKLAELSDYAYRVWNMGLVASDVVGRLSASPRKFHAEAMPMTGYDEAKLKGAFEEMRKLNLCHFYEVEGKRYMVFHDHDEHNKTSKNLKHQHSSKLPYPPFGTCYCVAYTPDEEKPVSVDLSVDPSVDASIDPSIGVHVHVPVHVPVHVQEEGSREEIRPAIRHLLTRAKEAKMPGRRETLISYLEAWTARSDAGKVEQYLMDPWSRGKTVIEFQDHFFPAQRQGNGMSMDGFVKEWSAKR